MKRHVRRMTEELTTETWSAFERLVLESLGQVLGLDIYVTESPEFRGEDGQLSAGFDGDRLVLYLQGFGCGQAEILINGQLSRQAGYVRADGFYMVKSGGMHQGIISCGMQPIEEALIHLIPAITVVKVLLLEGSDY